MVLINLELEVAESAQWKESIQGLVPITGPKPAAPSSTTLSRSSLFNNTVQHQTINNSVEYMDVELYKAAASDEDDVDRFISVLERVSAENWYSLSDIFRQVSPFENTLLHVAASHENLGIMQLIGLHCPSMIMKQNSNGDTALHVAAGSGCHFVVCTLLRLWLQGDQVDYRATYEIIDDLNLLRVRNKKGNTALHETMINGHKHCAFLLIDKDPEVSYFLNMKGESPLYLAAKAGYEETINFMFQEIRNKDECLKGKSPLQAAITRRNKGLISMILQNEPRFINLRDKEGRTALHYAAFMGYNEEVQYLLELFSASPIERDNDGLFPIHLAATEGHIQTIRVLLPHYPDPKEMLNLNGQSILHIATNAEKHDVVSYILKNHALGFLINCRDLDGNTALHLAAIKSNALIVSTMVQDMRVDLEIINNEGLTVLDVVEQFIKRVGVNEKQPIWVALSAARYTNARSWCSLCGQSRD